MSEMTLKPNEKLDVRNILKDLDKYEPKRRGWTWRKPAPNLEMGPFTYHDVSEPLKQSVGLPPAQYFPWASRWPVSGMERFFSLDSL